MDVDECRLVGVTDDLGAAADADALADYVEFRLGSAENPRAQLSNYTEAVPLVLSPRAATREGDALDPDEVASIAAAAPPGTVETVEIEAAHAADRPDVLERLRELGVQLLISSYDEEKTPPRGELKRTIAECRKYGDLVKIVVRVEDEGDALTLLECLNDASKDGVSVAGYGSGAAGRHTRVISAFYGSRLVYAPIRPDECSGEISLKQLGNVLDTITNTNGIECESELADSL
ncbi:type I 3-dehydroquinate dehydratase [Halogeometricum luteum]|uniref:3-dehydroquinate dehydratase n=1 Tax=Halogeometricum luteum TaxID=2950537 RepID=A0ABU2FYT2_9EURY|nr:type I 3-dehydroquinate dehydratase [Halogeometricum sp. S3BR5-2]MDS0293688.1 type I 3-dehydroquinate dehydratase [Halogeometricum sp. S3BR5-2]